jgi:ketosteroid isomerase-like protein
VSIEADNEAAVRHFMEVFSTGDIDAFQALMTDDATWWVAGTMPGISGTHGKAAFKEMNAGIAENAKTGAITLTPKAFTCQGDRVAVETESYCELKNGRVYNNQYHFVFELRDGKIASVKEYLDTEHTTAIFLAA